MNISEVKKFFTNLPNKVIFKCLTDTFIDDYDNAYEVLSNALDKQLSMIPIKIEESIEFEWLCPCCKNKVGDCVEVDNFCKNCGQKIKFN